MKKLCILLTLVLLIGGCKPVQTVQERYVTTVDSTAVVTLKEVINQQVQELHTIKAALEQSRQENTRLNNEILSHTVNYDTQGTVDSTTGKYPIASETTTSNKSIFEKTIKQYQTVVQEYEREVKALAQKNSNLQYEVDVLKDEKRDVMAKIIPTFNLKSFLWGILVGVISLLIFLVARRF